MARVEFTFYGGAREFARYHGSEALIHGPAETGKSISALWKLHLCALKYAGAQIVILRKTQTSANSTIIQTWQNKVITGMVDPSAYGGGVPQWFDYHNGARVWVMGMDKPGKLLSGEFDIVYINQAEELSEGEWETIMTRTTGRAGNMPYSQTIGDCNPTYPTHWMYARNTLKMFYSRHEENPMLYNQATGKITEQGKRSLSVLDALTGVRKERLRYGRPSQAEGAVYEEWNPATHLVYEKDVPPLRRYIAAQDWGYTNAGALGIWGVNFDGSMYLVEQWYQSRRSVDWWVETVLQATRKYRLEVVVCDPAQPEFIDSYRAKGVPAVPATNAVLPGIDAVQQRIASSPPRLFVVRGSLLQTDAALVERRVPSSVEEEFPQYVWADKTGKEQPVKEHDHGMDMVRYAVMYMDGLREVQQTVHLAERVAISPY